MLVRVKKAISSEIAVDKQVSGANGQILLEFIYEAIEGEIKFRQLDESRLGEVPSRLG
jgi:hypothetical protein